MLAQDTADQLAPVFALIAGLVVTFGPLAIGLTKLVDGIRSIVDRTPESPWPDWVWIAVAFVIGIGVCLGFEINVADALIQQVPAFNGSTALEGAAGSVFTGAGMAGMASYWHNTMKVKSAKAAEAKANAVTTAPPEAITSQAPPPTV
jgi:membrane-bound ClpP family serine protease